MSDGDKLYQDLTTCQDLATALAAELAKMGTVLMDVLTVPTPVVQGASNLSVGDFQHQLEVLESQVSLAQRCLTRAETEYASGALVTAQHIIGVLRHAAGNPRPFDVLSAPIQPAPGSFAMPELPEKGEPFAGAAAPSAPPAPPEPVVELSPVPAPVKPQADADLRDAPPHVGVLIGAYFAGKDDAKANILNTPVAEGGPFSAEQMTRWRRALTKPAPDQDPRGSWVDLEERKERITTG